MNGYNSRVDYWNDKLDNNEISYEEYIKQVPRGYEIWQCANVASRQAIINTNNKRNNKYKEFAQQKCWANIFLRQMINQFPIQK